MHISELSEDHIEDPSQVVEVGKAYSFKLIRMDRDEKRIGLSLKESRPVEEEPKSSDKPAGKDGRVSLGDIFDLSQFQKKDGE